VCSSRNATSKLKISHEEIKHIYNEENQSLWSVASSRSASETDLGPTPSNVRICMWHRTGMTMHMGSHARVEFEHAKIWIRP